MRKAAPILGPAKISWRRMHPVQTLGPQPLWAWASAEFHLSGCELLGHGPSVSISPRAGREEGSKPPGLGGQHLGGGTQKAGDYFQGPGWVCTRGLPSQGFGIGGGDIGPLMSQRGHQGRPSCAVGSRPIPPPSSGGRDGSLRLGPASSSPFGWEFRFFVASSFGTATESPWRTALAR